MNYFLVVILLLTLTLVHAKPLVKDIISDHQMALSPSEELKEAGLPALSNQVNVADQLLLMLGEDDDDVKTELAKKLKEHLDEILEKIKDAIDKGKSLKDDYIEKFKEIRQKLKDLKVDEGETAKKLIKKIKDKAKDYWQKILDKLTGKND